MIKLYETRLSGDAPIVLREKARYNYGDRRKAYDDARLIHEMLVDVFEAETLPEEHLWLICLNNKNRLQGVFEVSVGTKNYSVVGMKELFQKALLANASNIVIAHNHPSGDSTPSSEDMEVTKTVKDCGDMIGIKLLDHIVVGQGEYYSFHEQALI